MYLTIKEGFFFDILSRRSERIVEFRSKWVRELKDGQVDRALLGQARAVVTTIASWWHHPCGSRWRLRT